MYFYYEERDDDNTNKCLVRMPPTLFLLQLTCLVFVCINESLAHLGENSVCLVMFSLYFLREQMCKNCSHVNICDDCIRSDNRFNMIDETCTYCFYSFLLNLV